MKYVSSDAAPAAIGPYSQGIEAGNLIFTSGQIALDLSGNINGTSIAEQTEQVVANLKEVLLAAGSSIENVVKTTCFLKNIGDFAAFNEIYAKHFVSKPARSCVEVSALPKGALVEIEVTAEPKSVIRKL